MKKRWALLTVLVALGLGAGAGAWFGNVARPAMHLAIGCMMLAEAQKSGILDQAKSNAVIDKLKESKALNQPERDAVANMKSMCAMMK